MTVLKPDNRKSIGPFFHAGAGGAAATTRKRQESQLLQGLRELLTAVTPEPSQPPVNTDDTWVTVVRRRSGKGKGKGKVVSTPNKDVQPSLLEALKDLVRNAENGQAGSLLQKLTGLFQTYTSPQPKPRQVAQESMRNTGRWISDQPKIATRLVGQPKGGSSSWVKVDKIWWKKTLTPLLLRLLPSMREKTLAAPWSSPAGNNVSTSEVLLKLMGFPKLT